MNRMSWFAALMLFSLPLVGKGAPFLKLVETEYTDGPVIGRYHIEPILEYDTNGEPHLNLDPQVGSEQMQVVGILQPGVPIDEVAVRDQIAAVIAGFPERCLHSADSPSLAVAFLVSPIEDIDRFVPGVTDKRRITSVYVSRCLKDTPKECFYSQKQTGDVDFSLGNLVGFLRECRAATLKGVSEGQEYWSDN